MVSRGKAVLIGNKEGGACWASAGFVLTKLTINITRRLPEEAGREQAEQKPALGHTVQSAKAGLEFTTRYTQCLQLLKLRIKASSGQNEDVICTHRQSEDASFKAHDGVVVRSQKASKPTKCASDTWQAQK